MSESVTVPVAVINDLFDVLERTLNYVSQAQIIVEDSARKGASILHGMGERVQADLATQIDVWTP